MKLRVILATVFVAGLVASVAVANPNAVFKKKPTKVTMCHLTGSKRLVTITVSRNAVKAHLRIGDKLGACPAAKRRTVTVTVNGPTTTVTVTQPCTTTTSTTGTTTTTTGTTSTSTTTTTTTGTTTTTTTAAAT